ncbi:hypothetical protein GCM10022243_28570 [Saccharothrix violaceirubra]|uniref:Uncharacterized protein n=1 Tax=Saccharothrix violaceirubra TaxID=413306 RepID=A0A7W7T9V1_9PSEU|nr:hypothetical protein [Saccharothrix violaceirubra]MBB4969218.1 hypothetical protein [Saccharothrix violaceirubra]
MTISQVPDQSSYDAPTVRTKPVTVPTPAPAPVQPQTPPAEAPRKRKSTLRRLARRIVGPTILTKK